MKIDAGRVSIGQANVSKLIQYAYKVKNYQVTGPDWLQNSAPGFDIEAKFSEGATAAQAL